MNNAQTIKDPSNRRVLIVDDNRDAADTLAMMLKFKGFETFACYNGLDGVAKTESYQPMAIVLDIGMPDITGYEACRRIRESAYGKAATIIALTGYGSENDRQKSADVGFDAHLLKPVDLPELLRLLSVTSS
jgi:CheY-like chemotaxis protein